MKIFGLYITTRDPETIRLEQVALLVEHNDHLKRQLQQLGDEAIYNDSEPESIWTIKQKLREYQEKLRIKQAQLAAKRSLNK